MRRLSDNDARVLRKILRAVPDGAHLLDQIAAARVKDDSTPTFLSLIAPAPLKAAGFKDGPLAGRFPVTNNGTIVGEILVWLEDGRISGLEYAWVSDEAPSGLPVANDVEVLDN